MQLTNNIDPEEFGAWLLEQGYETWMRYIFYLVEGRKFIVEPIHIDLFQTMTDIFEQKEQRININVPPRSAKTTIAKYFIAYCWTINPKMNFIYTSYSESLLANISKELMTILEHPAYKAMYPQNRVIEGEQDITPTDDKEILDGVFEHLAIVENPRYEDAFIAVNAYIAKNNRFDEKDHPRDDEGKFTDGSGDYFQKWEDAPEIELKGSDLDKYKDIKDLRKAAQDYYQNNLQGHDIDHPKLGKIRLSGKGLKEYMHTTGDVDKLRAIPQLPDIIKTGKVGEFEPPHKERKDEIVGFYPIYANLKTPTGSKKAETLIGKDKEGNLFYTMFLDYNRKEAQKQRDITSDQDRLSLSNSITDFNLYFNPNITISKGTDKYNKVFDYIRNMKGESMDNETKGLFSQLLDALKARNEADDEKDKKDCDKASNDDVDKRKLIDEVGGMLKGKVDEELWRTIIGKLEKVAYDKSEAGTADNKAKNEDDEDDKDKKEDKKADEEAKNKCRNEEEEEKLYEELKEKTEEAAENKKAKNSFDALVNQLYSAVEKEFEPAYISPKKGIELGEQIYGK